MGHLPGDVAALFLIGAVLAFVTMKSTATSGALNRAA
jgi:hypothetical protein